MLSPTRRKPPKSKWLPKVAETRACPGTHIANGHINQRTEVGISRPPSPRTNPSKSTANAESRAATEYVRPRAG